VAAVSGTGSIYQPGRWRSIAGAGSVCAKTKRIRAGEDSARKHRAHEWQVLEVKLDAVAREAVAQPVAARACNSSRRARFSAAFVAGLRGRQDAATRASRAARPLMVHVIHMWFGHPRSKLSVREGQRTHTPHNAPPGSKRAAFACTSRTMPAIGPSRRCGPLAPATSRWYEPARSRRRAAPLRRRGDVRQHPIDPVAGDFAVTRVRLVTDA